MCVYCQRAGSINAGIAISLPFEAGLNKYVTPGEPQYCREGGEMLPLADCAPQIRRAGLPDALLLHAQVCAVLAE